MSRTFPASRIPAWQPAFLLSALFLLAPGVEAHRIGHTPSAPLPGVHAPEHADHPAEQPEPGGAPAPDRVRELIERYHQSGDDRLLDQGWALLTPSLDSDRADPATLLAAAWLAQAGHAFDRADSYLRHVLLLQPDHGEAWLLHASIALVQDDVDTAREACRRTMLTVPVVVTAACFARVQAQRAEPAELRDVYRRFAATLTARPPAASDLLGWLQGVAADLAARAGLPADAERHYQAALALTPTVSVRAGYAELLLHTGRPGEVLDVVRPSDTAPALVLRRILAQRQLGQAPTPPIEEIDQRFRQWIERDDLRHAREMALFYLHVLLDPARAFRLAERNYRAQREPEDRALLCEAAARVHAPVAADCPTGPRRLPAGPALSSVDAH